MARRKTTTRRRGTKAEREFVSEAEEILEAIRADTADLSDGDASGGDVDPEVINRLFRSAHSLKALAGGDPKEVGGGRYQAVFGLNQGIAQDAAKELSKAVRDSKLKVQVQIQGNQLRVQGKKRDDLQQVIAMLKDLDYRLPLQYVNFRD